MMTDREALKACQTLAPSLLTAEQCRERLKTINVLVYAQLGDAGARAQYEQRKQIEFEDGRWIDR